MTRDEVRALRIKLEASLPTIAGWTLKMGNASFTEGEVKFQLLAVKDGADSSAVSSFRGLAPMLGLSSSDIGRTFSLSGHTWTIMGMAGVRSTKISIKREDGKMFKIDASTVKLALRS